eukprot:GEMP01023117.1.p1 GENE.GEMP01023117.1~~GEMP01023117.1.p1  ORF type:complete len:582 (+),score=89.75 GEMP01023117.1:629-2374(+)
MSNGQAQETGHPSLWRNIGGVWGLYIDPDETAKSSLLYGVRERFQVTLINQLDEPTLMHWHGLTPPNYLDGVPWISSLPIQPNETVFYDFSLYDRGFYWMHSHFGHHLEEGLFAPIIIEDSIERRAQLGFSTNTFERNILMIVVDTHWRTQCAYNYALSPEHCPIGGFDSWANYSFAANFRSTENPFVRQVDAGQSYRLRILIAGSMATWQIHLPEELNAEFIATDGKDVEPGVKVPDGHVTVGGQRWDVRINIPPKKETWYTLRATRRPNHPLKEDITEQVAILLKTSHAADTAKPLIPRQTREVLYEGYQAERQFRSLDSLADPQKKPDVHHKVRLTGLFDGSTGRMQPVFHINDQIVLLWPATIWCKERASCRHTKEDSGFSYKDFCVGEERTTNVKCDEFKCPAGKSGNADGRCFEETVERDTWEGVSVNDCHLWTIRMSAYTPNKIPLKVCEGDRVWITYMNEGDDHHPMHLHGTHQQVININGVPLNGTMRDTVYAAPFHNITVAFNAFNPGQWALHCHIAHHTASGMVTTLEYETIGRCRRTLYEKTELKKRFQGNKALDPTMWPAAWLDVLNT